MAIIRPNGNSSGVLTVDSTHVFDTTTERDTYYTTNSSELVNNAYCIVSGELYVYKSSTTSWVASSTVISGADAPDVQFQYSDADDSSATWSDTYDESTDYFWRWSTDGGDTWSDAAQLQAYEVLFQYSNTGDSDWHTTQEDTDMYWRWSTDNGNTWSDDYVVFSGESSGGFPAPYTAVVNDDAQMDIYKNSTLIGEWDENGLWVRTEVTTGTGSFHLGEVWSLGSGGLVLPFISNLTDTAYFSPTGSVTLDGATYTAAAARVQSDLQNTEPNGSVDTSVSLDFNAEITTINEKICVFRFQYYPAEDYTGELRYVVSENGLEIASFKDDVILTTGTIATETFAYPLWVGAASTLDIALYKVDDDDDYLSTYAGSTNTSIPYRKLYFREWEDYIVYHEGNISDLVDNINDTFQDADGINWAALKNIPYASEDEAGVIKIDGTTITIDDDGIITAEVGAATKVAVSSEAEMLALEVIDNLYIVTRTDLATIYYLNAGDDPSSLSNWIEGAYVGDTVSSFNGRTGAVEPADADYNLEQILVEDESDSSATYRLVLIDGVLYLRED